MNHSIGFRLRGVVLVLVVSLLGVVSTPPEMAQAAENPWVGSVQFESIITSIWHDGDGSGFTNYRSVTDYSIPIEGATTWSAAMSQFSSADYGECSSEIHDTSGTGSGEGALISIGFTQVNDNGQILDAWGVSAGPLFQYPTSTLITRQSLSLGVCVTTESELSGSWRNELGNGYISAAGAGTVSPEDFVVSGVNQTIDESCSPYGNGEVCSTTVITVTAAVRRSDCTGVGDSDGDGVDDCSEIDQGTNPFDDAVDTDGDGNPDATDPDDDNDGVPDEEDAFPKDASESVDTDGDGEGDNADPDDDNDGSSDTEEENAGSDPKDATSTPSGGPTCLETFEDSYRYDARVPIFLAPDPHFHSLVVNVEWCSTPALDQVLDVTVGTSTGGALYSSVLGVFGFEPDWIGEAQVSEFTGSWIVEARGAVCFDLKDVFDRLGLKDKVQKKLKKNADQEIYAVAKEYGDDLASEEAREEILERIAGWLGGDVDDVGLDNIDKKLEKGGVPEVVADMLENAVQDGLSAIFEPFLDELEERLLDPITPDELVEFFVEHLFEPIDNFGRFCEALIVWVPEVTIDETEDGLSLSLFDTYIHPLFESELIED